MSISIAITTYNRSDLTIEVFSKVYDHPLVSEICIVDDASEESHWNRLLELIDAHPASQKINVFRNEKNLGMSRNKAAAVSKAKNEWVVLFDSDNVLYPEYLDAFNGLLNRMPEVEHHEHIIFCPSVAEPDYDFTNLPCTINRINAKNLIQDKMFRILLNICNYIVHRDNYLSAYEYDETIKESDTIHFNHLWLKKGGVFWIVPNMKYYHRRHSGSGWLNGDHSYNLKKAAELQEKIKNL